MRRILASAVLCTLLFGLAAASPVSLPESENPTCLAADGNEIFILDGHTMHAYSLRPFALTAQFGKKGKEAGDRFVRIIAVHILNRAFFHLLSAVYEVIADLYEGPFDW